MSNDHRNFDILETPIVKPHNRYKIYMELLIGKNDVREMKSGLHFADIVLEVLEGLDLPVVDELLVAVDLGLGVDADEPVVISAVPNISKR